MAVGPVDMVIMGFPGNKFTGRIAPALMELVDSGTIRVIDLLFVMKDADGTVATIEAADLDPETGPAFVGVTCQNQARSDRGCGRSQRRPSSRTVQRC